MASLAYAVAFTVTLAGFTPGAGVCNQMPLIEPFWLLYPDSNPPHPGLLLVGSPPKTVVLPVPDPPLPDPPLPPPEPGLLMVEGEAPHPAITRTWSANTKEQRRERRIRNMGYPDVQILRCSLAGLYCFRFTAIIRRGWNSCFYRGHSTFRHWARHTRNPALVVFPDASNTGCHPERRVAE